MLLQSSSLLTRRVVHTVNARRWQCIHLEQFVEFYVNDSNRIFVAPSNVSQLTAAVLLQTPNNASQLAEAADAKASGHATQLLCPCLFGAHMHQTGKHAVTNASPFIQEFLIRVASIRCMTSRVSVTTCFTVARNGPSAQSPSVKSVMLLSLPILFEG